MFAGVEAVEDGIDVIVAAGGDGTVNEVINGIFAASAEPEVTMAVLPLGSANDFARSCGISPGGGGGISPPSCPSANAYGAQSNNTPNRTVIFLSMIIPPSLG